MNTDVLLYRQINSSWVQSGRVTRQAFKPSARDGRRLSVYDGGMITAEDAWKHYTGGLGFASTGVLAVSRGDCAEQELPVKPDPVPHPAHAVIDFTACSNTQVEKKAKRLIESAWKRGWQYKANATP